MNPNRCAGRTPTSLDGIEHAAYNVLAQYPSIPTHRVVTILSGHDGDNVRQAVRCLKAKGLIYKSGRDSCANALWKVKS